MSIKKSVLAEAIDNHWSSLKNQCVEVPELVVDGAPVVIYFDPLTLAERDKLRGLATGETIAQVVIMKAVDSSGGPLFTAADKQVLMNRAAGWVADLAERILTADACAPSLIQNGDA